MSGLVEGQNKILPYR